MFKNLLSMKLGAFLAICVWFQTDNFVWAACEDPTAVYDAHVIFGMDQFFESAVPMLVPMDANANTLERRQTTYRWFEDNYGIVFDPNEANAQDDSTGAFFMSPVELRPEIRYFVFAMDDQHSSKRRFKMKFPISNACFYDSTYIAVALVDSTTTFGFQMKQGDAVFYGSYRLMISGEYSGYEFVFHGPEGAVVSPPSEVPSARKPRIATVIPSEIESDAFGSGFALITQLVTYVNETHSHINVSSRMNFPRRLDDPHSSQNSELNCQDLSSTKHGTGRGSSAGDLGNEF